MRERNEGGGAAMNPGYSRILVIFDTTEPLDRNFYVSISKTKYIPLLVRANKIEWLSFLEGSNIILIAKKIVKDY